MATNAGASDGTVAETSASAGQAVDRAALDEAFEALKTYDYGGNRSALTAIDDAVVAALGDPAAGRDLEGRLAGVLASNVPTVAKDYVCRKLGLIGSAASVPALSGLLSDKRLSVAARAALERIPGPEAARALRESVSALAGPLKVGAINSLGVRRDAGSVAALAELLDDRDIEAAGAAAVALGNIGSVEAGKALLELQPRAPEPIRLVVADACLACAERLFAKGRKREARALCEALTDSPLPEYVQLAAKRCVSATD